MPRSTARELIVALDLDSENWVAAISFASLALSFLSNSWVAGTPSHLTKSLAGFILELNRDIVALAQIVITWCRSNLSASLCLVNE